ncbi:MAG: hypothetical protein O2897_00450 [bacterium]|nr:hypothetical protein [bacterium]
MHRLIMVLFALLLSACSIEYLANSGPKPQAQKKVNELCKSDDDCLGDLRCLELQLENCNNDINCQIFRTRGDLTRKCSQRCDIQKLPTDCPEKQRCFLDVKHNDGICLTGTCDSDVDCGTNNSLQNKCVDRTNGEKSGLCALSCNPLNCSDSKCADCPLNLSSCEPLSPNVFVCATAGVAKTLEYCDAETIFCSSGRLCFMGRCFPYCNLAQDPSICPIGTTCQPFYGNELVGICTNQPVNN